MSVHLHDVRLLVSCVYTLYLDICAQEVVLYSAGCR